MTLRRFARKLLKITGILTGSLLIFFIGFHFWFIHYAKGMLEDLVRNKSGGRISLHVGKLRYNYFTRSLILKKVVLSNTDTTTANTAYRFSVPKLQVQLTATLPFLLHKELLIDSLTLQSPSFEVTKLRSDTVTTPRRKKDVSIPYEMGKVYHSIQDALHVLSVNRFQIDDARFILRNATKPDAPPLSVSKIHFHMDGLQVDESGPEEQNRFLFSDNLVLKSDDQQILFPDGRHRLSFSKFRINIRKKVVSFDSCHIEVARPDSSAGSFRVYFDALYLTNIDFDTLYRHDVIKADSVYCIRPRFNLRADLDKSDATNFRLRSFIEQLTGNLAVNYLVVSDADFDIRTQKNGIPNSYLFSRNNFEMQGLRIEPDAADPIHARSFRMAIRNYETFIRDSTYSVTFDSVLFREDRVILSNFLFHKFIAGKIINTIRMPYFSLEGLSWDDLIFEKQVKARRASMYNPDISYTYNKEKLARRQQQGLSHSLGALSDYMELEQVEILNGKLDLWPNPALHIRLENADLSMNIGTLLSTPRIGALPEAVNQLAFRKGEVVNGTLKISLEHFRYTQKGAQLKTGKASIEQEDSSTLITLHNFRADDFRIDERSGATRAEKLNWDSASILLRLGENKPVQLPPVTCGKIDAGPTRLSLARNGRELFTQLRRLDAGEVALLPDGNPVIENCKATGDSLAYAEKGIALTMGKYTLADRALSRLQNLRLLADKDGSKAQVRLPMVELIPDVASLLQGHPRMDRLYLENPVIDAVLSKSGTGKATAFPEFNISDILVKKPRISFLLNSDRDQQRLVWDSDAGKGDFLLIRQLSKQLRQQGLHADSMAFLASGFSLSSNKGSMFGESPFFFEGIARTAGIATQPGNGPKWYADLTYLITGSLTLNAGKKQKGKVFLDSVVAEELYLDDSLLHQPRNLLARNKNSRFYVPRGYYATDSLSIPFSGLLYNRPGNIISVGTLSVRPHLPLDSFLATCKFQQDYILLHSRSLRIENVDIDTYAQDGSLHIHKVELDSLYLYDYKDKNLTPKPGRIKPLPANLLRRIPVPISIDSVILQNGLVDYTEVNDKTKAKGNITVNRLWVQLINVRNHEYGNGDSLFIRANGYLLDTVWTRLRVKESYVDTEGGFIMTLRMKPGDLRVLNRSLIPLANVKLLSGQLDTLSMRAVGRDLVSVGEMEMYFRDLKVQLRPEGVDKRPPFFFRVLSSLANTFVIRRNNRNRTGQVFYVRDRDKSAVNYLIRIAISGMVNSVGVKRNKRELRRYNRELGRKNLPPQDL